MIDSTFANVFGRQPQKEKKEKKTPLHIGGWSVIDKRVVNHKRWKAPSPAGTDDRGGKSGDIGHGSGEQLRTKEEHKAEATASTEGRRKVNTANLYLSARKSLR